MKTYKAKFWRSNPQLKNGGYETERTIEAKTIRSAEAVYGYDARKRFNFMPGLLGESEENTWERRIR